MFYRKRFLLKIQNSWLLYCFFVVLPHTCDVALWYTVKSAYLHTVNVRAYYPYIQSIQ